jgi:glycosyltransferase involved in cell wall biosynthesis
MAWTISLIIATYNVESTLQTCLDSVRFQVGNSVEVIVIDGGSKDKTLSIINQNSSWLNFWISEPDQGIYDAWNKGLKVAKGDWIMFLGADDVLLEGSIEKYVRFIDSQPEPLEYISSRMKMIDKEGRLIRVKGLPWSWPRALRETVTAHPGSLHSKSLFEKYGNYNIDYKIVGDTELLLRAKGKLKYAFLDEITVAMQEGGASDSFRAIKERFTATVKTGGALRLEAFWYTFNVSSKFFLKKGLRKVGINLFLKRGCVL